MICSPSQLVCLLSFKKSKNGENIVSGSYGILEHHPVRNTEAAPYIWTVKFLRIDGACVTVDP